MKGRGEHRVETAPDITESRLARKEEAEQKENKRAK